MSTRADAWPAGGIQPDWTLTVVPSTQDESGLELPLSDMDDRRLVEACLGGTIEAFDVIVERHQRAVYQLCFRFVRRHEDAADLAQEVFLRAYRGLRRFRGDAAMATWLYRIGPSELNSSPDWSPDGRKLVYTSLADGNAELFVLDLTTGRNTRVTRSPGIDTSPAWSPNGREIAFTSDRSGTPQIYVMDADGLNVRRITTDGNYSDSAAWSPRGDRLAYVTRVERKFQIQMLDVASGRVTPLTSQGNTENARFSPDGRHLVFASDRAGAYDIYTMAIDGSDVRRLTKGGDAFTPDWSLINSTSFGPPTGDRSCASGSRPSPLFSPSPCSSSRRAARRPSP